MNNQEKRDRFERLASQRTCRVLYRLKVLGNCSNRQMYEYDKKDIDKIFKEIERRVKDVKAKFYFDSKDSEFKL